MVVYRDQWLSIGTIAIAGNSLIFIIFIARRIARSIFRAVLLTGGLFRVQPEEPHL